MIEVRTEPLSRTLTRVKAHFLDSGINIAVLPVWIITYYFNCRYFLTSITPKELASKIGFWGH